MAKRMSDGRPILVNGNAQVQGPPSHYRGGSDSWPRFKAITDFQEIAAPTISSVPPARRTFLGKLASDHERKAFMKVMDDIRVSGAIFSTHDVPDADGLGASYAIWRYLFLYHGASGDLDIATRRMIPTTNSLVDHLQIPFIDWSEIKEDDLRPVIILDTNSHAQFTQGEALEGRILLVIDHHKISMPALPSSSRIINEEANSTCEIIASLIPADRIDPVMATALAAGVSSDSARLSKAGDDTLKIFRRLRRISGIPRHRIDELAFPSLNRDVLSSFIDELASLDVRKEVYRNRLIMITRTLTDPPALLSTLMREMDIDFSATLHETCKQTFRMSLRVSERNANEYGIEASWIAGEVSRRFGVASKHLGGGHKGMGGATVPGSYMQIANTIILVCRTAIDRALGHQ